jgi:hypothetical protein
MKEVFSRDKAAIWCKKADILMGQSGQFLEQKRLGEQENRCHFPAMPYSLPYFAKFKQGMQIYVDSPSSPSLGEYSYSYLSDRFLDTSSGIVE